MCGITQEDPPKKSFLSQDLYLALSLEGSLQAIQSQNVVQFLYRLDLKETSNLEKWEELVHLSLLVTPTSHLDQLMVSLKESVLKRQIKVKPPAPKTDTIGPGMQSKRERIVFLFRLACSNYEHQAFKIRTWQLKISWPTFKFMCLGPVASMVRYGRLMSVWRAEESSTLAFSAASRTRWRAIESFVRSMPC